MTNGCNQPQMVHPQHKALLTPSPSANLTAGKNCFLTLNCLNILPELVYKINKLFNVQLRLMKLKLI